VLYGQLCNAGCLKWTAGARTAYRAGRFAKASDASRVPGVERPRGSRSHGNVSGRVSPPRARPLAADAIGDDKRTRVRRQSRARGIRLAQGH
jgi:hypothetical protein